jgi:hypothetical protein
MVGAAPRSELQNLAQDVDLAGTAMACRYSSSDEYEAALIAERRQAGAYRKPLWHRPRPWIICMIAGAAALIGLPFIW